MSKIRPAPDRRSADQGALRGPDRRHGADRRKRIRHTIETTTPVVVRGGGMIQWGLARNWSAGGMLIEVGSSIGIGEAVEIKISGVKGSESAPEAVTVKGEVRHQLAWRYGEDGSTQCVTAIGVRFTTPSSRPMAALESDRPAEAALRTGWLH